MSHGRTIMLCCVTLLLTLSLQMRTTVILSREGFVGKHHFYAYHLICILLVFPFELACWVPGLCCLGRCAAMHRHYLPECGDLQRRILQSGEARALLSTFRETGVGIIREMCKYLLINILMSSLVCTKDPFPFNFFLFLKLSWLVSILL